MEITKLPSPRDQKLAGKALGKCLACLMCPGVLCLLLLPLALETVTALGLQAPGNFEMVAVTLVRASSLLLCAVDSLGVHKDSVGEREGSRDLTRKRMMPNSNSNSRC